MGSLYKVSGLGWGNKGIVRQSLYQ